MFTVFRNAWKIQDLRKKILYTILIIVIFRIGCAIPVPFINAAAFQQAMANTTGSFTDIFNVMSGGSFKDATLFALSITPYINASIIINLLTVAIPALERLSKEGEAGRQKINKITKIASLILSVVLAIGYYLTLKHSGGIVYSSGATGWFTAIVIIAVFSAGASLIMWLGDCINEKGIGNGISMILFASIVSRGLDAVNAMIAAFELGSQYYVLVPIVIAIFVVLIGFVVYVTEAERRIPIQYAKMVKGRKMYGGQNTHIPIKVAMNGVMPIIFAMSLMSIPSTIVQFTGEPTPGTFWYWCYWLLSASGPLYAIIYFLLIIGFSYFYSAIQYNPIEIANNLRKNNGGIPGIRPGKPTSDYIQRVLNKITLVGAFFLGVIAIIPILIGKADNNLMALSMGGTTILIAVSVALETTRTLESHLMMRHHKGFLS